MAGKTLPLDKLKEMVGQELGTSDWLVMDQNRISTFADCTLDDQWIHIDEEAAAKGPFGKTVAHGFLSVSLLSHFGKDHVPLPEGNKMAINYGLNKVRLINPVTVGSKIRDRIVLADVAEKGDGRILITTAHTVEIEGVEKPALIAEALTMFFT